MNKDIINFISVFMVLFAIIDIFGSLPVIVSYKNKGNTVNPLKISLSALGLLLLFLFSGELLLKLFRVDVSSFAVAGSIVIFFISLEMVLGLQLFKQDSGQDSSIIPIVFPLIAGPGSITTLISLRAEYSLFAISLALVLNMFVVFFVLRMADKIAQFMGKTGLFIMNKFFGIILMAIAVKLFVSNINVMIGKF